jgi:hypothetical protein
MFKKLFLPMLIVFLFACCVFAQTSQTLTLKPGFNFIGFTTSISSTPAQLKTQNSAIEDIYLFSAAAGSFLSANDGTLLSLAAGKGYIFKNSSGADVSLNISGDAVSTIGNINLKTGFNLIGFSKIPSTTSTFKSLMNIYPSIKGMYKWSSAAGSFIQVVRANDGTVTLLDGVDPTIKAGESYFFNMTEDTTINYDGTDIILGSGPPAPVAKTLEITGTVGASATAAPSYSAARAIDLSSMQMSVYDEINNVSVEGATITSTGANTFKATLPVATADRYLSVLVKNSDNKVIYKSFLGRVPKAAEVSENTVKISNIKVSDESTARAIIVLENRAKIPVTAVMAKTSVDASVAKTDFTLALEEHIAGLEDRVPELKQAVNLIANVLTTAGVDNAIKEKVTEFTFSESSKLLSSYVSLLQDATTLQTVNQITVPTQLNIGNKQITAQSTQVDIYETVAGINDTIGQRVEMPVLDPPPGQYNTPVLVKMTCVTPNANIVYDYGDGNPGITYTAPVSINKTCTLNVAGFRSDWPMSWHSKFVNATYTIGAGGGETTETRILSSITLDKTSEAIVVTTEKYYLSNVKIFAHYSNGDSKEVQATRWEMVSSPGSFSDSDNSYYLWNKTGDAIFNAVYSENGIEKKIEFKLMTRTLEELGRILKEIKPTSESHVMASGGMIYLPSLVKIDAYYYDGTTKEVAAKWKFVSGIGSLSDTGWYTAIVAGSGSQETILNAEYSEGDVTKSCDYKIIIPGVRLSSLKLTQIETVIKNGDKYDLSQIKAVATYSGGGTKEVEIGKWNIISGNGNMLDKTFNSEIGCEGMSIVSGTYIDGEVSKSDNFYISITSNIVNNSLRTGISEIKTEYIHPVSGGSITLGDDYRTNANVLINADSIEKPTEYTFTKINHSMLYDNQELYVISTDEQFGNLSFVKNYYDKKMYSGGQVKIYYIDPVSHEQYLLKTTYSAYAPKYVMTEYGYSGNVATKIDNNKVTLSDGTLKDLPPECRTLMLRIAFDVFNNIDGADEMNSLKCPYYKQKSAWCLYTTLTTLVRAYNCDEPTKKITLNEILKCFNYEEFNFDKAPTKEDYEKNAKSSDKYIKVQEILKSAGAGDTELTFYYEGESFSAFLDDIFIKTTKGIPVIFNSTKQKHALIILGISKYDIIYHNPNNDGGINQHTGFQTFKDYYFPDDKPSLFDSLFYNMDINSEIKVCYTMSPSEILRKDTHLLTAHAYDDSGYMDSSHNYIRISKIDKVTGALPLGKLKQINPFQTADNLPVSLNYEKLYFLFEWNMSDENGYSFSSKFNENYVMLTPSNPLLKHDIVVKFPIYNSDNSNLTFDVSAAFYNADKFVTSVIMNNIVASACNKAPLPIITIKGDDIKKELGAQSCNDARLKVLLKGLDENNIEKTFDGFEIKLQNYPE